MPGHVFEPAILSNADRPPVVIANAVETFTEYPVIRSGIESRVVLRKQVAQRVHGCDAGPTLLEQQVQPSRNAIEGMLREGGINY